MSGSFKDEASEWTHLVEFVTEIYRIDVVAFQV